MRPASLVRPAALALAAAVLALPALASAEIRVDARGASVDGPERAARLASPQGELARRDGKVAPARAVEAANGTTNLRRTSAAITVMGVGSAR